MSAFSSDPARRRLSASGLRGHDLLLVGASGLAVILAFVLVHKSPALAFAAVLIPFSLWVIARRTAGLVAGLVLLLVLPYWQTLGTAQLSVLRVASIGAATTILFERRRRLCVVDFAVLLFVAVIVLGWLLQYDVPHAGRIVSIELTPIGFYIGARAITPERLPQVMLAILGAGTVGALTVIYEYVHGSVLFVDPAIYDWKQSTAYIFRPGGVFGSPPGAATVLTFVILFGLAAVRTLKGRKKLLASGCIGICGLALLTTFTRGNMIALAIGVLVFLWLIRSPLLRPTRAIWFASVAGLVVLTLLPTIQSNLTFQKGILRPGTLAARESYWSWALPVATSSPHNFIFGVGTAALETPVISQTAPVVGPVARVPQAFAGSLHSQYMTTLIENGVIGLAALVFLLLAAFLPPARAARATRDGPFAAVAASVVAIGISMSVGTDLLAGPTFAMLMTSAGFAATSLESSKRSASVSSALGRMTPSTAGGAI
jgi:O-antigen ligase